MQANGYSPFLAGFFHPRRLGSFLGLYHLCIQFSSQSRLRTFLLIGSTQQGRLNGVSQLR